MGESYKKMIKKFNPLTRSDEITMLIDEILRGHFPLCPASVNDLTIKSLIDLFIIAAQTIISQGRTANDKLIGNIKTNIIKDQIIFCSR